MSVHDKACAVRYNYYMNTVQKYIGIVILFILLILGIGIYMIKENHVVPDVPVVTQVPVLTPKPTENDKIIEAVKLFATSAPAIFEENYVCKGGFINEEIDELKRISDTIVRNRIFDPLANQYAINQDEAGISCLESGDKWVLFTALNQSGSGDTSNYYCVDSQGAIGSYAMDTKNTTCLGVENPQPLSDN